MTTTDPIATGLANFRDLGGLPTDDGATTRPGVLYRSDAPHAGDPEPDAPVWPPALVIDLRSADEPVDPHPLRADGTLIHRLPLLGEARPPTLDELRGGAFALDTIYRRIAERAGSAIGPVLRLLTATSGPALVHCAAGKDRTGVLIALLLRAAGVTHQAVVTDYTLTTAGMSGVRRRLPRADENLAALLAEFPDTLTAPATAISDVLDPVERHPSGPRGWLLDHRVDPALLDGWTDRLLGSPRSR